MSFIFLLLQHCFQVGSYSPLLLRFGYTVNGFVSSIGTYSHLPPQLVYKQNCSLTRLTHALFIPAITSRIFAPLLAPTQFVHIHPFFHDWDIYNVASKVGSYSPLLLKLREDMHGVSCLLQYIYLCHHYLAPLLRYASPFSLPEY